MRPAWRAILRIYMGPLATFLWYLLWFSVAFSATVLWVVAVSDIRGQMHKGVVTTARSMFMVVAVSIAAVGAVGAADAVVPHGWIGATPKGVSDAPFTRSVPRCQDFNFAYSFGVEQPTHASQQCK